MRVNIKFIILIIIAFVFAFLSGGNLPYRIFYGLLAALILSLIFITLKIRDIKVETKLNKESYYAGDTGEIKISICDSGIISVPYVQVNNNMLAQFVANYNGDALSSSITKDETIKNDLEFKLRGNYDFSETTIKITDLFNIFSYTKHIKDNNLITVYPKVYELHNIVFRGNGNFAHAINQKSSVEEPCSTRDVRKYKNGDNLRRIHWKLSAKYGELYVKNLDTISAEECNIFLDMNRENYEFDKTGIAEEEIVDFCCSLINYMVEKNLESYLYLNNKDGKRFCISSRDNFNEMLDFFVHTKSDGILSQGKYIDMCTHFLPKSSWIGVIRINIDPKTIEKLVKLKDSGYRVTLFHLGKQDNSKHIMNQMEELGIECIDINTTILNIGSRENYAV